MAEKRYHPAFLKYMNDLVEDPAYTGLAFTRKPNGDIVWVAPKVLGIGQERIRWAEAQAEQLGIDRSKSGWLSKVMFELHPTKVKPCQICGKLMSIKYLYLNKALIAALEQYFDFPQGQLDESSSIVEVAEDLLTRYKADKVALFFIKRIAPHKKPEIDSFLQRTFGVDLKRAVPPVEHLVAMMEAVSRAGYTKGLLGPGAMSNFPDRYDGYHSYNRCCRKKEDTGRFDDNMRTYNKDRRAYVLWSDGLLRAANLFMKSVEFKGMSADHIGPISLGFKHHPQLFQKLPTGLNSAKRDRLDAEDIEKLIKRENKHGINAASLHCEELWAYIREHYRLLAIEDIREVLKLNVHLYLELLYLVKQNGGASFLVEMLLKPKFEGFRYHYTFEKDGSLKSVTERSDSMLDKEEKRFCRVSLDSLDEYHEKENRRLRSFLLESEQENVRRLLRLAAAGEFVEAYRALRQISSSLQQTFIRRLAEK